MKPKWKTLPAALAHNSREGELLGSVVLLHARGVEEDEEGRVAAVPQAHRRAAEPRRAVGVVGVALPPVRHRVRQRELDGGAHREVGERVVGDWRQRRVEVDPVDCRGRHGADDAAAGEAGVGLKRRNVNPLLLKQS